MTFGAAEQEGGQTGQRERQFWKEGSRANWLRGRGSLRLPQGSFGRGGKFASFPKFILGGPKMELGPFARGATWSGRIGGGPFGGARDKKTRKKGALSA